MRPLWPGLPAEGVVQEGFSEEEAFRLRSGEGRAGVEFAVGATMQGAGTSRRERLRHAGPCLKTRARHLGLGKGWSPYRRALHSSHATTTALLQPTAKHIRRTLPASAPGVSYSRSHVSQQPYEDRVRVSVSILQMRKLRH